MIHLNCDSASLMGSGSDGLILNTISKLKSWIQIKRDLQ